MVADDGSMSFITRRSTGAPQDAFVLVIAGPSPKGLSLTIHRPIGVTGLDSSEWVMTPSQEMQYYSQRLVDRREVVRQEERHKFFLSVLSGKGQYSAHTKEFHTVDKDITVPNSRMQLLLKVVSKPAGSMFNYVDPELKVAARVQREAEERKHKEALAEWNRKPSKGRGRKPKQPQPEPVTKELLNRTTFIERHHIGDGELAFAKTIMDLRKSINEQYDETNSAVPYATMGGIYGDRPQRANPALKGMDIAQAQDAMLQGLLQMFSQRDPASVLDTEATSTPNAVKSDD